jgi:methylglyoxal synthase
MNIALVAHDARKQELVEWCTHNAQALSRHTLYGTGTTARLLGEIPVYNEPSEEGVAVMDWYTMPLRVVPLLSGPLGGDQQIGAMIAEGKIDCLIFFCDNLITQGHQQDVMALVRLASLYNIAFATNRSTADHIITSPLFGNKEYKRIIPGAIENYRTRKLENERGNNSTGCDKGISVEPDTSGDKACDQREHGNINPDCGGEGSHAGSDES